MAMAISMSASVASKVFGHSPTPTGLEQSFAVCLFYFVISFAAIYTLPHPSPALPLQVKHMVSPVEAATYAD